MVLVLMLMAVSVVSVAVVDWEIRRRSYSPTGTEHLQAQALIDNNIDVSSSRLHCTERGTVLVSSRECTSRYNLSDGMGGSVIDRVKGSEVEVT